MHAWITERTNWTRARGPQGSGPVWFFFFYLQKKPPIPTQQLQRDAEMLVPWVRGRARASQDRNPSKVQDHNICTVTIMFFKIPTSDLRKIISRTRSHVIKSSKIDMRGTLVVRLCSSIVVSKVTKELWISAFMAAH